MADFKALDLVVDCEFTDFIDMHLVSMGLVGGDRALYLEVDDYPERASSEFVRNVVVPLLNRRDLVSNVPFMSVLSLIGLELKDVAYFRGSKAECRLVLYKWLESWQVDLVNVYANYSGDLDLFADLLVEDPVVSVQGSVVDPTVVSIESADNLYDDFSVKGILSQEAFISDIENDPRHYEVLGANCAHHALVDAVVQYVSFRKNKGQ